MISNGPAEEQDRAGPALWEGEPSLPCWRAYNACSYASSTKSVVMDLLTRQTTMLRA